MLDWQRTLFAAFIGGLVGFLASILMEWLKPFIASRVLRARMKEDIYDELSRFLVIAYRLAETPDKERTDILCPGSGQYIATTSVTIFPTSCDRSFEATRAPALFSRREGGSLSV